MAKLQASTKIEAPPAKVYDYLLDFSRHKEWAAHPLEIHPDEAGEPRVGATYKSSATMMGHHDARIEITELVPNQKIAFDASDDTGRFHHDISIEAAGEGAMLTKTTVHRGGSLMNKVMFALLGPMMGRKIIRQDVSRIKERVEGSAG